LQGKAKEREIGLPNLAATEIVLITPRRNMTHMGKRNIKKDNKLVGPDKEQDHRQEESQHDSMEDLIRDGSLDHQVEVVLCSNEDAGSSLKEECQKDARRRATVQ
jgi:hypothetical protein